MSEVRIGNTGIVQKTRFDVTSPFSPSASFIALTAILRTITGTWMINHVVLFDEYLEKVCDTFDQYPGTCEPIHQTVVTESHRHLIGSSIVRSDCRALVCTHLIRISEVHGMLIVEKC